MCGCFLIFSVYAVVLNGLAFNFWLSKGKKRKRKMMRGEEYWPFKYPACHFNGSSGEEEVNKNGSPPLGLLLWAQKQQPAVRARIPDIWMTVLFPTVVLASCVHAAPGTCTAACHLAEGGGWVAATVLRAEMDCNLRPKPSPERCKPLIGSRVPKYLHPTDLDGSIAFRWGDRFMVLGTPSSSHNPLSKVIFSLYSFEKTQLC